MGTAPETSEGFDELLAGLATGDPGDLTAEERARVEAHLPACPRCREHLGQCRNAITTVRAAGGRRPPEEFVARARIRHMAATRAGIRDLYLAADRQRQRRITALRAALAAASLLTIGLGLWHLLGPRPSRQADFPASLAAVSACRQPPVPVAPAASPKTRPSGVTTSRIAVPPRPGARAVAESGAKIPRSTEIAAPADGPEQTLRRLNVEFATAKAARNLSEERFGEIIVAAKALAERWPTSDEAPKALLLVSRCYTEMADPKQAQEAFLAYADALGSRERRLWAGGVLRKEEIEARAHVQTVQAILNEARRLFEQADYLLSMSYCDVLQVRYPGQEAAGQAQILVAQYYQKMHQHVQAIEMLQGLIRAAPGTLAARGARALLPHSLCYLGRAQEAVRVCMENARSAERLDEKANWYHYAALYLVDSGQRFYPEAIKVLQTALRECPGSRYEFLVKGLLARTQAKAEREILGM